MSPSLWTLIIKPKYWPWWLSVGMMWCLAHLPYRVLLLLGRQLGRLAYWLTARRRHIALINLTLCFPELSDVQRKQLLHKHFESFAIAMLEMPCAWWWSDKTISSLVHCEGLEHLDAAVAQGKGVILLSAHFGALEIGGRYLSLYFDTLNIAYREHENQVLEYFFKNGRKRHTVNCIPRYDVREMIKVLKKNQLLWLAVDQNYGHKKSSVFANFFNIPAATNTATARLAKISGAAVVPYFTQRLDKAQGYRVIFLPALDNFPSTDLVEDITRVNQLIEQQVRLAPEQYLWVHRRFKDRPEGEKPLYPI